MYLKHVYARRLFHTVGKLNIKFRSNIHFFEPWPSSDNVAISGLANNGLLEPQMDISFGMTIFTLPILNLNPRIKVGLQSPICQIHGILLHMN